MSIFNETVSEHIYEDHNELRVDMDLPVAVMIKRLRNKYCALWWENTIKPVVTYGKTAGFWCRKRRAVYTNKFIDQFLCAIKNYPGITSNRREWNENIQSLLKNFISKVEFIDKKEMEFLICCGILEETEAFMRQGKEFDSNLKIEDIGQAMRNVWIMNITQLLLGKPVRCTPSVFAYSMLYPYTDNYIDSSHLELQLKKQYNDNFKRKLSGEIIKPMSEYEGKIFNLVEYIESQYSRKAYPKVYESLIGIHEAQFKSTLQQKKGITPYDLDILGISIEKGGTSVLADAYLVKGNLNNHEINFFFAYGAMLQLCDDLQDVKEDTRKNHQTIFSITANGWPMDNITDKLFNLLDYVIELIDKLPVGNPEFFKSIIKRNCCLLIYFAICKNANLYTKKYLRNIGQYFPYNAFYMRRLYSRLRKKIKSLKPY
jgi:hypothetical protein